jgi:hypothetical protein
MRKGEQDPRIVRRVVEDDQAAPDPQPGNAFAEFFGAASFAAFDAKQQVLAA